MVNTLKLQGYLKKSPSVLIVLIKNVKILKKIIILKRMEYLIYKIKGRQVDPQNKLGIKLLFDKNKNGGKLLFDTQKR